MCQLQKLYFLRRTATSLALLDELFPSHRATCVTAAAHLTQAPTLVVISDRIDWQTEPATQRVSICPERQRWRDVSDARPAVRGSYLERLPLAFVATHIVDWAEIWHHQCGGSPAPPTQLNPRLLNRAFLLENPTPPFDNQAMLAQVRASGAPHILVVYGLGVSEELLAACANSVIVYNSIDAPSLRVPPEVSARFDLVLTGAQWQSDEVNARHPGMPTAVMPVGPEFAAIDQFRPLDVVKDYDLVYVAAAQPYKQHDLLLDALAQLPREIRALLVFGYGENADVLRRRIAEQTLSVDCIGPPGVPFDEVNRLMNRARFGVVCGRDDGAPAILTEYMLAGLPVLANAELVCGRQYILPETGCVAAPEDFAAAIMTMRNTATMFRPREAVLSRWTWPHTIERLWPLLQRAAQKKSGSDHIRNLSSRVSMPAMGPSR